ncbi:MAG: phosphotransferase [Nitrolancea sp.]
MLPLPATAADLTPEWLTSAMEGAPGWEFDRITSVDLEPLGARDSLQGDVYRADVGVTGEDGVVESNQLLIKMHDPAAEGRGTSQYRAEAYFYREVASRTGIPVPATYVSAYDEHTGRMLIIQEYLAEGHIGGTGSSFGADDLVRVLGTLARLHSTWWKSPLLDELPGIRRFDAMRRTIVRLDQDISAVIGFLERFGKLINPAVAEYYATLPEWIEPVEAKLSQTLTLIHLDAQSKNIFIPTDSTRNPVLFDWALFVAGNPALDLATLLSFSVDRREHGRLEQPVRQYHEMLLGHGVRDYAFEQLWDDFRLASAFHLVRPVGLARAGSAKWNAHVRQVIPRLDSIVLGTGALEALDELSA